MSDIKYFLVVDNGMQWQSAIIAARKNEKTETPYFSYDWLNEEFHELDYSIKGKVHDNICSRELHFHNQLFPKIGRCYGWTISKFEFDTLKRLIELKPLVNEYNRLVNG